MARDGCNCYFSFWAFFALLPPQQPENENLKTMKKKIPEISSFYTSAPKIMTICYTFPEIWHVTYAVITFHFGLFLYFYPPNSTISKKWKNTRSYHHFTHVYPKFWLDDVQFLRCVADGRTDRRTDGQTDRRKKWHIEVGAPPKKQIFGFKLVLLFWDKTLQNLK